MRSDQPAEIRITLTNLSAAPITFTLQIDKREAVTPKVAEPRATVLPFTRKGTVAA